MFGYVCACVYVCVRSCTCPHTCLPSAVPCPAGSMHSVIAGRCVDCPPGMFQDRSNQTHCLPCPEGTTSTARGATRCTGRSRPSEFSRPSRLPGNPRTEVNFKSGGESLVLHQCTRDLFVDDITPVPGPWSRQLKLQIQSLSEIIWAFCALAMSSYTPIISVPNVPRTNVHHSLSTHSVLTQYSHPSVPPPQRVRRVGSGPGVAGAVRAVITGRATPSQGAASATAAGSATAATRVSAHTHTHSLSLSRSSFTPCLSLSLSPSLSLCHTHAHMYTHAHTRTHAHTHTHSLSLCLSLSHTHTRHTRHISLSLLHTHLSSTLTHSLCSLSLSLSLSLSPLSLSLSLSSVSLHTQTHVQFGQNTICVFSPVLSLSTKENTRNSLTSSGQYSSTHSVLRSVFHSVSVLIEVGRCLGISILWLCIKSSTCQKVFHTSALT